MSRRLEPIFYVNEDPFYRSFITEIEECLNAPRFNVEKLCQAFQALVSSNMLPYELWAYLLISLEELGFLGEKMKFFELTSIYQLFYPRDNDKIFNLLAIGYFFRRKMLFNPRKKVVGIWQDLNFGEDNFVRDVQLLIDNLTYPHQDLKKIWQCYEKHICSSPPKELLERYTKSIRLYEQLTSGNRTAEERLELVMESDDVDFVRHNAEYIISSDFKNKKLWEMYLSYLQIHNTDAMLHTYSKCCRVFLNDEEMKEKYAIAVKELCKDNKFEVPWRNTFDFEKFDEKFIKKYFDKDLCNVFTPPTETDIQPTEKLPVHFTADSAVYQNLPFKDTFIEYILQNASANVQLKLSLACKYFYLRRPTFVCHSLRIENGGENQYFQQSVQFNSEEIDGFIDSLCNIYLSTVLYCDSDDRKCLSKLIQRMQECNARYITITNQDLTKKEFEFLVDHGNVIELELFNVNITEENGKLMQLEEIISMMPSIEQISGDDIPTNKETLTKLLAVPLKSKFDRILLKSVNVSDFDPEQVIEFLKSNVSADCEISINFLRTDNNEEEIDQFAHTVYFGIWGFWKGNEKPIFRLLA